MKGFFVFRWCISLREGDILLLRGLWLKRFKIKHLKLSVQQGLILLYFDKYENLCRNYEHIG